MASESKNVLFVDDTADERLLFARAGQKAGVRYKLHTVTNGQEAVDYLEGSGAYADRTRFPLPDLLVLDINMPQLDGFETLKWVRAQTTLRFLPVVMFSTSPRPEDIQKAYELAANSYVIKPANLSGLLRIVKMLEIYWLDLNRSEGVAYEEIVSRAPAS
jgi:CheY-like chemotaxis protein